MSADTSQKIVGLFGKIPFLWFRASSFWVFSHLYIVAFENVLLTTDFSLIRWLGTTLDPLALTNYTEKNKSLT